MSRTVIRIEDNEGMVSQSIGGRQNSKSAILEDKASLCYKGNQSEKDHTQRERLMLKATEEA